MSLPTFSFESTADEVATALAGEIAGKNVLVTGTSLNGIGFEAARVLAKHANLVIITGYNAERLKLSEEAIKKDVPTANIRSLVLDLSSLEAVRKAAAEVNAYPEPLHVLINNAAATGGDFRLTVDGFEVQMATDHFGPFLFTKLLTPKLLATRNATHVPRVVFVSSDAHAMGPGIILTPESLRVPVDKSVFLRYHEAKSANVLMAKELTKRAAGKLRSYSLHPGVIHTNVMTKEEVIPMLKAIGTLNEDGTPNVEKLKWKTIPQGAATTVVAAFDPRLNDKSGAYLVDCVEGEVAAPCANPANAEKLWNLTEDIIGEKYML